MKQAGKKTAPFIRIKGFIWLIFQNSIKKEFQNFLLAVIEAEARN